VKQKVSITVVKLLHLGKHKAQHQVKTRTHSAVRVAEVTEEVESTSPEEKVKEEDPAEEDIEEMEIGNEAAIVVAGETEKMEALEAEATEVVVVILEVVDLEGSPISGRLSATTGSVEETTLGERRSSKARNLLIVC
jgi:hypothetical protein